MKLFRSFGKGVLECAALLLAITAMVGCSQGCATAQIQKAGYVGAKDVADLLETVQAEEIKLKCGAPTAPAEPACVPPALHRTIQGYILEAAGIDRKIAAEVRKLGPGKPTRLKVLEWMSQFYLLVRQAIDALPDGPQKAALAAKVGR